MSRKQTIIPISGNLLFIKASLLVVLTLFAPSLINAQDTKPVTSNRLKSQNINEKKLLKQGRKLSDNGIYDKARKDYIRLLKADSTNFYYNYELAVIYHINTTDCRSCAIPYFERASRHFDKDSIYDVYYYLGQAYQFQERYDDAIRCFQKLNRFLKKERFSKTEIDEYVNAPIDECNIGKKFKSGITSNLSIQHLDSCINDAYPEYVPLVSENDSIMLFTSRKKSDKGGMVDINDGKFYEDMFISRKVNGSFCKAERFLSSKVLDQKKANHFTHDAVAWMSYDGTKLITYKDEKIYLSEKDGNRWSKPKLFPDVINMSDYQPSGSISPDGNTLYFSSDKVGGFGGLDIYKSEKQKDGSWGPATNLGPTVNSVNDDDSPNIWIDGKTLFFSSITNSMGGYDIFVTKLSDHDKWSKPINMGVPVNSPGDDIFFKPNANFTIGYFSSFRKDSYGDMDIYRYKFLPVDCNPYQNNDLAANATSLLLSAPDTVSVDSLFTADASKSKIKNDEIKGYDWDFGDGVSSKVTTAKHRFLKEGEYCVHVVFNVDYTKPHPANDSPLPMVYYTSKKIIALQPKKYVEFAEAKAKRDEIANGKNRNAEAIAKAEKAKRDAESAANSANKRNNENIKYNYTQHDLDLIAKLNTSDVPKIMLENIYFDKNKSSIREDAKAALDRNISRLKAIPNVVIQIEANTDSRGKTDYNLRLSNDRAYEVIKYLSSHGIKKSHLITVALADNNLVNQCAKGVDCDEADHQKNRRDDFRILGTLK
jgi:outer membrane protein OmpA-like peptidoglycan-associated protein/tetratricopeptide (TPR) repeat protein